MPDIPSTFKSSSLSLLRSEVEKLRNSDPEKTFEIRARIDELNERVIQESEGLRAGAMNRVKNINYGRMMAFTPPPTTEYQCPKCHRPWPSNQLNYQVKGKGKRKKKVPWCPQCNLQIFPVGDEGLIHPIFPVEEDVRSLTLRKP